MKTLHFLLSALLALILAAPASASVLTFDSVAGVWSNEVDNDFGGYNTYRQDGFLVQTDPGDHTDSNTALSIHNQCCNRNDDIRVRLSYGGDSFDFLSFLVSHSEGTPLHILSSANDALNVTVGGGTRVTADMYGVTWVDFWFEGSTDFGLADLDNFVVRAAQTAEVPEPASLALFGLAFAALASVRRRRG